MFEEIRLGSEFFEKLTAIDEAVMHAVRQGGCRACHGPLHRGDFPRKPRWGSLAIESEAFGKRFSLCCGREGCRQRATPPSVRFLGRRVYVGAVVLLASVVAITHAVASSASQLTGVPPRTTRRWLRWWRGAFISTPVFVGLSGRLVPAIDRTQLPASLLARIRLAPPRALQKILGWLAPLTTASCDDGSRFVRGLV